MEIRTLNIRQVKHLVKEENLLEFNRDIQDRHVDKMMRSIQSCGLLRLPVIGDISAFDKRKEVIIDGQHLLTAITLMGKEDSINKIQVMYKVYKEKEDVIADIAKLNNTQKTWTDIDYLSAWTSFGKDNIDYYWNYHELTQLYNRFEGIPVGFLVDLFAKSKDAFKEGTLTFKDKEFSLKVLQIAHYIKTEYSKPAHTLHGLRMWAMKRWFEDKREIDFTKLKSRLDDALRNGKDKNCNGREDFNEFIELTYTRL